jgi:hypothetical protein
VEKYRVRIFHFDYNQSGDRIREAQWASSSESPPALSREQSADLAGGFDRRGTADPLGPRVIRKVSATSLPSGSGRWGGPFIPEVIRELVRGETSVEARLLR